MAGGRQQQTDGKLKNQMTNFRIGAGLPKHQQYSTTYNSITGQRNTWGAQNRNGYGEIKAKITSV